MTKPSALSLQERQIRDSLEGVVLRGKTVFLEVCQALLELKEKRLYRETHTSFARYCRERLGLTRQGSWYWTSFARVHRAVAEEFPDCPPPVRPRQVRPLTGVPARDAAATFARASRRKGGQPTNREVQTELEDLIERSKGQVGPARRTLIEVVRDEETKAAVDAASADQEQASQKEQAALRRGLDGVEKLVRHFRRIADCQAEGTLLEQVATLLRERLGIGQGRAVA